MIESTGDRGQSVTLDYVLSLSIGFLLITGLVVAGTDYITVQQERAQRAELRVIGQQVAAEVAAADRLSQSVESDGNVRIERGFPQRVTGTGYTIEVLAGENASLLLATGEGSIEVEVNLLNETAIQPSTVLGGDIVVNRTATSELRIERGERHA